MIATPSPHDSRRFGFPIQRARCASPEELARAVEEARAARAELLIARFPTDRAEAFLWLARNARWYFGDTLVHYWKKCGETAPERPVAGYRIRRATPEDVPAIEAVADALFGGYSSHYRCNPRTADAGKLSAGYAEWAVDFILRSAPTRYCLLAEADPGRALAGYISGEVRGPAGHVVIGGIHPAHQKGGLYRWMLERWYADLGALGCEHVEFSTQIQNAAVQKVWTRMGFELFASEYTVHVDLT